MQGRVWTAVAAMVACAVLAAPAAAAEERDGPVYARVEPNEVVLGNGVVERRWQRASFATKDLVDLRGDDRHWSGTRRDFTLWAASAPISSESFDAEAVHVSHLKRGGLRVEMVLAAPPNLPHIAVVKRIAEAYPDVAGFRMQTTIETNVPLPFGGATLDEAAVGAAKPTLHAFRAGADWREPGWQGPPLFVGDPHAGTWRETRTADEGSPVAGPGQWLSVDEGGRSLFMVMERNDFPSSRGSYDGSVADLRVEYSRDLLSLGPFEEQGHVENPGDRPARQRVLQPSHKLALEPSFTGFGDTSEDEPWQFHRYLEGPRGANYRHDVTFNSNGTDDNAISTGAKDDMNLETVHAVAPKARALGIETFILDDGWQAASGDWEPDSPQHPEPRGTPPRFPDDEFRAVRDAIAPMRLGLWMSPMSFNPGSHAYADHPEWGCTPLGHGTAAANRLDPESGSNEAGIGLWGPDAIPHVESRIRDAIDNWGVTYFKFDFMVFLDCAGQGDLYDYKERFAAMLDRLRRDHPDVVFQMDETNDYRLFPFEAVSRGPTWFQNGSPSTDRLLHNLWNLSPWVPAYALGQHFLGARQYESQPVGTLMAAALLSHLTFFSDLRQLPDSVVAQARPWIDFYREHRELFGGVTYPLLDDPLDKGWTALQSWDPDAGRGALLAFRQDSGDATRRIALKNVPPGRTFAVHRAPGGESLGTFTSAQLASGIDVSLPETGAAEVLTVEAKP